MKNQIKYKIKNIYIERKKLHHSLEAKNKNKKMK